MTIPGLLEWLANTPWSIALHESQYMWPFTESLHVLTLAWFVGTTIVLDLRLLGVGFARVPASAIIDRLLPWTRAGFAVMIATGLMLFYATPVQYYHSIFFRVKMILLVAAGLNVFVFHTRTLRTVAAWEGDATPPRAARVAALVSLVAWAGVVVTGRMIAYNWFDCEIQPQPAFINWAAGCPKGTP
jgi:hypothetical protein